MFKPASSMQVVFRRRYRGASARSKRRRSRQEQAILDARADGICVYELQGVLGFGTMERVLRQLTDDLDSVSHLVLDMTRVLQIDDCVPGLIERLDALAASHPEIRTRLVANLVHEMAARLRSADAEIRTLEE